jgi:predicted ABC-type ATPase
MGSYLGIPRAIREQVNALFESFVLSHIEQGVSCAFETTLRSGITFDQAALARNAGFVVEMRYVALWDLTMHLERVKMRADAGGHSAPESILKIIYDSSINNLARAIREMGFLYVYDNTRWGAIPKVLLQAEDGEIVYVAENIPVWLKKVLEEWEGQAGV